MGLDAALRAPATQARPRIDAAAGRLVGSRCEACGAGAWPARAICHACGSAAIEFGWRPAATGRLLTYTTVWVPRPGLQPPYVLGQVALDAGVEVFAHVRGLADDARVPLPVRLVAGAEGEVPAFWFEPVEVPG